MKLRLEDLVTSVATDLMAVTTATLQSASRDLLHRLVDYFEVDLSFLRRNDHELGATVLVAEWPPRPDIPDPDPLGVIMFAGAAPTSMTNIRTEFGRGPASRECRWRRCR